jgi:hypothetical protein
MRQYHYYFDPGISGMLFDQFHRQYAQFDNFLHCFHEGQVLVLFLNFHHLQTLIQLHSPLYVRRLNQLNIKYIQYPLHLQLWLPFVQKVLAVVEQQRQGLEKEQQQQAV